MFGSGTSGESSITASPAGGISVRRDASIDVVRGVAVVLVVLYHVRLWLLPSSVPARELGGVVGNWVLVEQVLGRGRMPSLLFVSGVLSVRLFSSGASGAPVVRRVWGSLYLYMLWLCVYQASYILFGLSRIGSSSTGFVEIWKSLVWPGSTLWFLVALAGYCGLTFTGYQLGIRPPLQIGIALAAAIIWGGPEHGMAGKIVGHYIYFLLGVSGHKLLRRISRLRAWWFLVLFATALLSLVPDMLRLSLPFDLAAVISRCAFLPLCVAVCAVVARSAPGRAFGNTVGRRTVAIYLCHPPIVLTLGALVSWRVELPGVDSGAFLLIVSGLTAVVIISSLGIHRLCGRFRLDWLFRPPPYGLRTIWRSLQHLARRTEPPGVRRGSQPTEEESHGSTQEVLRRASRACDPTRARSEEGSGLGVERVPAHRRPSRDQSGGVARPGPAR